MVIGASAGGIEALQQICRDLPATLKAAVLVVLHMSPQSGGELPRILSRAGHLVATFPTDGEPIVNGRIYVAPPDRHLVVEGDRLRVINGPRENRHRPAVDPTFRSAARSYGSRVIGVVLTGSLDDGTSGLMVVCEGGGQAIVQDPEDAMFPSMPLNAIRRVPDALVVPLAHVARTIVELVSEQLPNEVVAPGVSISGANRAQTESEFHMPELRTEIDDSKPSSFGCPECGGVLWEIDQSGFLRFRCRVGHAYTAMNLGAEQRHAIESALWSALRALEESAALYHRMADKARGYDRSSDTFSERADTADANADILRQFLVRLGAQEVELGQPAEHI